MELYLKSIDVHCNSKLKWKIIFYSVFTLLFYFLFFPSFSFLHLSLLTASPSLFSSSKPFFLPPQIHCRSARAWSQPRVGRGLSFGCCSKKRATISTTTIIAIDGLNLAYRYKFRLGWVMAYLIITSGHIKRTSIKVQIGQLGSGCACVSVWLCWFFCFLFLFFFTGFDGHGGVMVVQWFLWVW